VSQGALLALLQDGFPDEEGNLLVFGYAVIVAGVLDLLVALFIATVANMEPEKKRTVAAVIGMAGLGMIVIGVLIAFGVIG